MDSLPSACPRNQCTGIWPPLLKTLFLDHNRAAQAEAQPNDFHASEADGLEPAVHRPI